MAKLPGGVVAGVLTVSTDVPEPVSTPAGFNAQVGSGVTTGVTLQVRATALLKPSTGAIETVEVDDPPGSTATGASADAATVKSGCGLTVRLTVVLWLSAPEVPVTVTTEVPTAVVGEVVRVRAELTATPAGVTDPGVKAQLAPTGRLTGSQVSTTALLKPFTGVTEMVKAAALPAFTVRLPGTAPRLKSGAGAGAAFKVTVWMTQSPVLRSGAVAWQLPATDVI
jgi:hypothetical protein